MLVPIAGVAVRKSMVVAGAGRRFRHAQVPLVAASLGPTKPPARAVGFSDLHCSRRFQTVSTRLSGKSICGLALAACRPSTCTRPLS